MFPRKRPFSHRQTGRARANGPISFLTGSPRRRRALAGTRRASVHLAPHPRHLRMVARREPAIEDGATIGIDHGARARPRPSRRNLTPSRRCDGYGDHQAGDQAQRPRRATLAERVRSHVQAQGDRAAVREQSRTLSQPIRGAYRSIAGPNATTKSAFIHSLKWLPLSIDHPPNNSPPADSPAFPIRLQHRRTSTMTCRSASPWTAR